MRAVYEAQYGPAPSDATFGPDLSWWQGASNDAPSYSTTLACWRDRVTPWAQWACIRVSSGRNGVDTTWPLHVKAARETGYTGPLGAYHFAYPSYNPAPTTEARNFLTQWRQHPFAFVMLDMEDAAGYDLTAWARGWLDAVASEVPANRLLYSAAWFTEGNMAGDPGGDGLWVAHYAKGGTVNPGTGRNSIPRLPSWAGAAVIWQYDSLTAALGSLDLNIAYRPDTVGLAPSTPSSPTEPARQPSKGLPEMHVSSAVLREGANAPAGTWIYDLTYMPADGSEVAPGVAVTSHVTLRPVEFFTGKFFAWLHSGNGSHVDQLYCDGTLTTSAPVVGGAGLTSVVSDRPLIVEGREVVYPKMAA